MIIDKFMWNKYNNIAIISSHLSIQYPILSQDGYHLISQSSAQDFHLLSTQKFVILI